MTDLHKQFTVGGQDVEVTLVDNLDGKLGRCCLAGGYVKIAKTFNGEPQSDTSILNTLYHEIVHSILDTMGRDDLGGDETFVCTFSSFLTEALTTLKDKY